MNLILKIRQKEKNIFHLQKKSNINLIFYVKILNHRINLQMILKVFLFKILKDKRVNKFHHKKAKLSQILKKLLKDLQKRIKFQKIHKKLLKFLLKVVKFLSKIQKIPKKVYKDQKNLMIIMMKQVHFKIQKLKPIYPKKFQNHLQKENRI